MAENDRVKAELNALRALGKDIPEAALAAAIAVAMPYASAPLRFALVLLPALRKAMADHAKAKKAKQASEAQEETLDKIYEKVLSLDYEQQQYIKPILGHVIRGVERIESVAEGNTITLDEMKDILGTLRLDQANFHKDFPKACDALETNLLQRIGLLLDERDAIMSRLLEAEFEQEYLDELRREHGYLELLGIPDYRQHRLPIDLGYVSLSLAGDSDVAPARRAEIVLAEHRCLIVQGEAGAGKTTLMQWEAAHCRERKVLKKSRRSQLALASDSYRVNTLEGELVPFFIRLRNLSSPTDGRPPSAFPKKGDWLSMSVPDPSDGRAFVAPKGWLGRVLQEGRALVLFDGLDELRPEDREGFWRGLQALLEEHPGTHIRVTSRYFSREDERSRQWNPPSDPVTNKPVPVVEVQPLSPDGVDKLIDLWYEAAVQESIDPADRTRLKKEMEDYARLLKTTLREERYRRIYELARTPFLCAAICLINRNRRQLLPEARHELFRMLVVALLALRDKQRRVPIPEEFKNLSEVELVRIHSQLALDMMRGMERSGDEPADYMIKASRAQVLQWLQSYIRDLPSIDHTVRAEDLLDNFLVPRCGMLRTPEYGAYDFRHRALQEYLAGGQALQHNVKELANHADDDRWHDTIVMSVGGYNVGEAQATCLVKELIARGEREGIISLIASCWR